MHEMAIAASVLDIALEAAAAHQAERIVRIRLTVGELAGVLPDALQFCFHSVADGTLAADAELAIEVTPLRCHCSVCRVDFPVIACRFLCPNCGSPAVQVMSGEELRVDQIEVDSGENPRDDRYFSEK